MVFRISFLSLFTILFFSLSSVEHVQANGKRQAFNRFSSKASSSGQKKFARDLSVGIAKKATFSDNDQNTPSSKQNKNKIFFSGHKKHAATLGALTRILTGPCKIAPESPRLKNLAQKTVTEEPAKETKKLATATTLVAQEANSIALPAKEKAHGFVEYILSGFYAQVQTLLDAMKNIGSLHFADL